MRTVNGTTIFNNTNIALLDNLPQTPAPQSPQRSSSRNSVEFKGTFGTPDQINTNFAISPEPFGMDTMQCQYDALILF